ncbi:MAG: class I SAM-dependent methyltransferase [Hyphomicrobiales bacterium]|uniref:class I SAM-dependent methyltransferase n=1 Tax=Roseibium polysiphoniae TaxID=2571221 RepID=UPI003297A4F7
MAKIKKITSCEVCGSTNLIPLLDLGCQPMCDDLVPISSSLTPHTYPLELVGCENCVTVHQAYQVEKRLLFPQTYHYRAALTKDVILGMRELVESVKEHTGPLDGKTVLDIGCNDGSLLSMFGEEGAITCGVEPTGASNDAKPKVHWLHHGFFEEDAVEAYLEDNPRPDIITFTNVFAHIEDLNGLLSNLKKLLKDDTKLVIENHYLGAVVSQSQFDTFYHEHPRTYSFESFRHIAAKLDRRIAHVEFPNRYNGNIRVVIGNQDTERNHQIPDESAFLAGVKTMADIIRRGRNETQERLCDLVSRYGRLPGKAFPGRAAILVHSLGIDETLIDATYERSLSPKVGNYVPGTRIEIRDETEFLKKRLSSPVLVNFAWHIHDEISAYMQKQGYQGTVIPVWKLPT